MRVQDFIDQLSKESGRLVKFAEEFCDWDSADYYDECEPDGNGGWVPADGSDYSINDAAADVVREWLTSKE